MGMIDGFEMMRDPRYRPTKVVNHTGMSLPDMMFGLLVALYSQDGVVESARSWIDMLQKGFRRANVKYSACDEFRELDIILPVAGSVDDLLVGIHTDHVEVTFTHGEKEHPHTYIFRSIQDDVYRTVMLAKKLS